TNSFAHETLRGTAMNANQGTHSDHSNRRAAFGLVGIAAALAVTIAYLAADGGSAATAGRRKAAPADVAPAAGPQVERPAVVVAPAPGVAAAPAARPAPANPWPTAVAPASAPVALGAARTDADDVAVERAVLISEGLDDGRLNLCMNKSAVLS